MNSKLSFPLFAVSAKSLPDFVHAFAPDLSDWICTIDVRHARAVKMYEAFLFVCFVPSVNHVSRCCRCVLKFAVIFGFAFLRSLNKFTKMTTVL